MSAGGSGVVEKRSKTFIAIGVVDCLFVFTCVLRVGVTEKREREN